MGRIGKGRNSMVDNRNEGKEGIGESVRVENNSNLVYVAP